MAMRTALQTTASIRKILHLLTKIRTQPTMSMTAKAMSATAFKTAVLQMILSGIKSASVRAPVTASNTPVTMVAGEALIEGPRGPGKPPA